jgi:uncharacterized repeat protein (TIGR03837 family)
MPSRPAVQCHLFCRVIDNFGDAGVCWRLSRQLSTEYGWRMRLYIDQPDVLHRIAPQSRHAAIGEASGEIEVAPWPDGHSVGLVGDVVIEAFACRLPDSYVQAMTERPKAPVWINLEYLSAEPWVEACHGLPSPDPASGLIKHFFFPGFSAATGGLIRERAFQATARHFQSKEVRRDFLGSLGARALGDADLPVSAFCYPDSPLSSLISTAESVRPAGKRPLWLVPETVAQCFPALGDLVPGRVLVLPFMDQDDFDRLLLSCELNFVRGEDSFVRAQLAARPFVWQAYRQTEDAHRQKLHAFLAQFLADAGGGMTSAVREMFEAWNGFGVLDETVWRRYALGFGKIADHGRQWLKRLDSTPNLAEKLVRFCESRL